MALTAATVLAGAALGLGVAGAASDRRAARETSRTSERNRQASEDFISARTGDATKDVLALSPIAEANRLAGFKGAFDVQQQFLPQQLQAFQQGNITAQDIQQQGLTGQQGAILGTGLPGFQAPVAQQLPDFSQIALPQFQTSQQAFAQQPPTEQEIAEQIRAGNAIESRFTNFTSRGF